MIYFVGGAILLKYKYNAEGTQVDQLAIKKLTIISKTINNWLIWHIILFEIDGSKFGVLAERARSDSRWSCFRISEDHLPTCKRLSTCIIQHFTE